MSNDRCILVKVTLKCIIICCIIKHGFCGYSKNNGVAGKGRMVSGCSLCSLIFMLIILLKNLAVPVQHQQGDSVMETAVRQDMKYCRLNVSSADAKHVQKKIL